MTIIRSHNEDKRKNSEINQKYQSSSPAITIDTHWNEQFILFFLHTQKISSNVLLSMMQARITVKKSLRSLWNTIHFKLSSIKKISEK